MAPKIGGNREIPAYFFVFVLLKLLSTSCGVAELSASVMICLIALLLKNKKLVCLLSCRQAYWIIDIIHSISKVYTPLDTVLGFVRRWIFTQNQWYMHPVDWNTLNSNRISQKLSEFFECLDVGDNHI